MRIVYLHGWGGKYDEEKFKILSKFGDEVFYPQIEYSTTRNLINYFSNDIYRKKMPTLIVGTSLGGYFAYHISDSLRYPALMFNPAFYFKNGGELKPNDRSEYTDKQKVFVISKHDEELDSKRTLKFLKEIDIDPSNINLYEDIGHRVPLDIFEKEFTKFREKYKDFTIEVKEEKKQSECTSPKKSYITIRNDEPVYGEPAFDTQLAYEEPVADQPTEQEERGWWESQNRQSVEREVGYDYLE